MLAQLRSLLCKMVVCKKSWVNDEIEEIIKPELPVNNYPLCGIF